MQGKKAVIVFVVIVIALGAGWYLYRWLSPELNKEVDVPAILRDNKDMDTLKIASPAFEHEGFIPSKYTCDGDNISPPLSISGVPEEAKSLVLIMDDPDVPKQLRPEGVFDHWTLYNIPPSASSFGEGEFVGTAGLNGRGDTKYTGPCPPPQYQPTTHRYFFRLYATDIPTLNFTKTPTKAEVLTAIQGHIIVTAELMGKYDRTLKKN